MGEGLARRDRRGSSTSSRLADVMTDVFSGNLAVVTTTRSSRSPRLTEHQILVVNQKVEEEYIFYVFESSERAHAAALSVVLLGDRESVTASPEK